MYNLSWTQALEAMHDGAKVKHEYFSGEEFFEVKSGRVVDEDGYCMDLWFTGEDWQSEGWRVLDGGRLVIVDEMTDFAREFSDVGRGVILQPADVFIGIDYQREPKDRPKYNLKIFKGRGHNKLKRKKK